VYDDSILLALVVKSISGIDISLILPEMLMHLIEFTKAVALTQTPQELGEIFHKVIELYGLNYFIASTVSHDARYQKEKHHGIVGNYPQDWVQYYKENHLITCDPVYKAVTVAQRPFLWHDALDSNIDPTEKRLMEEASDFRLKDGVGLAIYQPQGQIFGLGLASSDYLELDRSALLELYAFSGVFILALNDLLNSTASTEHIPHLTKMEKTVLNWLARGKNRADISDILNITESTVKFHCQNIYTKLEVDNSRLAVIKALRMNMIHPY